MVRIKAACTVGNPDGAFDLVGPLRIVPEKEKTKEWISDREYSLVDGDPTGYLTFSMDDMECPEHDDCQEYWRIFLVFD